jgi:hypothetical protein
MRVKCAFYAACCSSETPFCFKKCCIAATSVLQVAVVTPAMWVPSCLMLLKAKRSVCEHVMKQHVCVALFVAHTVSFAALLLAAKGCEYAAVSHTILYVWLSKRLCVWMPQCNLIPAADAKHNHLPNCGHVCCMSCVLHVLCAVTPAVPAICIVCCMVSLSASPTTVPSTGVQCQDQLMLISCPCACLCTYMMAAAWPVTRVAGLWCHKPYSQHRMFQG